MKLIDILVKELKEWPKGHNGEYVNYIISCVYSTHPVIAGFEDCPYYNGGSWETNHGFIWSKQCKLADDHCEAIITKLQWEKAKKEKDMHIDTSKARVYQIDEISVGDKFYVVDIVKGDVGNPDIIGKTVVFENLSHHFSGCFKTGCGLYMTVSAYKLIKIEEEKMKKEFTKADMKDGMRCVLRNGDQMFWNAKGYENPMILGSKDMEGYDDEAIGYNLLNDGIDPALDIMEVYALGELVWKREEESEEQKKLKMIYSAIEKLQEQAKAIVERK